MRDLSFQEALEDPDMPFRQFVRDCVDLWKHALELYEAAGSPNGHSDDADNLSTWALAGLDGNGESTLPNFAFDPSRSEDVHCDVLAFVESLTVFRTGFICGNSNTAAGAQWADGIQSSS